MLDLNRGVSNFDDIKAFHGRFQLPALAIPGFLDPEMHAFRSRFLQEELNEFHEAYEDNDLAKAFDALIDLVYVALGTAFLMNLPWQDGWDAVQAANMAKVRALRESDSTRGSTYDVVKPEGWQAPDIEAVIERWHQAIVGQANLFESAAPLTGFTPRHLRNEDIHARQVAFVHADPDEQP